MANISALIQKHTRSKFQKLVLIIMLVIVVIFAYFTLFKVTNIGNTSYSVESYDVTMVVGENRTIAVTEVITVKFTGSSSHGIIRDIPTNAGEVVTNLKATCNDSDFNYYVTNRDISGFASVYLKGNELKTGKTISYTLTYDYIVPVDEAGDNAIVLNIIGYGWTVPLNNVTAKFILPYTPINEEYYSGDLGSETNSYATINKYLSDDLYIVELTSELLPLNSIDGESACGITGYFEFEDGLLSTTNTFWYKFSNFLGLNAGLLIVGIFALVVIIMAVITFLTREKEKLRVPVVTFTPPFNLDPLKIGKYYDGRVDDKDIFSLVYYLAQNGYLNVVVEDEKAKNIRLVATERSIEDNTMPAYVVTFYKSLFASGKDVLVSNLSDSFYSSLSTMKKQLDFDKILPNKEAMYKESGEKRSLFISFLSTLFLVFSGIFVSIIDFVQGGVALLQTNLDFWQFLIIAVGGIFAYEIGNQLLISRKEAFKTYFKLFILFVILAIIMALLKFSIVALLIVMISGVILAILEEKCVVRSDSYIDLLGQIDGFKAFITATEKDKLEMMLKDEPNLYYNVLPYAQVLGVSDIWEEKFKSIPINAPIWIQTNNSQVINAIYCGIVINHISSSFVSGYTRYYASMATKMATTVSTHGRSGSGGHFGGGGHGGGGGRGV